MLRKERHVTYLPSKLCALRSQEYCSIIANPERRSQIGTDLPRRWRACFGFGGLQQQRTRRRSRFYKLLAVQLYQNTTSDADDHGVAAMSYSSWGNHHHGNKASVVAHNHYDAAFVVPIGGCGCCFRGSENGKQHYYYRHSPFTTFAPRLLPPRVL